MDVNSSNPASPAAVESTGDDNGDDKPVQESGEVDDLVAAMKKVEITERRSREKALKRPMLPDSESDEEEPELYDYKTHKELSEAIPDEYRRIMKFMGGKSQPYLVAVMRLRKCDLEERLVIPARKIRCHFLSKLEEEEMKREKRLKVEIVDPKCTVSLVTLTEEKEATAAAATAYVISDWSGIVERMNFEEGSLIELWSFRVANGDFTHLCFLVLFLVPDLDDGQ